MEQGRGEEHPNAKPSSQSPDQWSVLEPDGEGSSLE
jgi:hypothetical protein